jgi:hypothetical protein
MSLGRVLIALLSAGALGACAGSGGEARFRVPEDRYAETFDAARRALVDMGFVLDRVDAQAGVITTRAKPTSGLATPWDREQSTPGQELEEFLNRTQRRARVTFEPVEAGEREVAVEVLVERVQRRGWSPAPVSVRQSTFWRDPRGGPAVFATVVEKDERLASRLGGRIARASAP